MKILVNDGMSAEGVNLLKEKGFEVITLKVPQEQLADYINQNNIDVLLVRSATKVRQDLIDATQLKIVGRGGVGLDNIDVEYAKSKGVKVINTPGASSDSVGEMVIAHAMSIYRNLHQSNRRMPMEGDSNFKDLKKEFGTAYELRGKTIGIIGFGRIGRAVAKNAVALGMSVIGFDAFLTEADVELEFFDGRKLSFHFDMKSMDELLKNSDIITLHVPSQDNYIIGEAEINKMKDNSVLINTARGGVVDEKALLNAIESGKLLGAALDVFEEEPKPSLHLLMNDKLSLSPHLAGSTVEAQDRIGIELAEQIIELS